AASLGHEEWAAGGSGREFHELSARVGGRGHRGQRGRSGSAGRVMAGSSRILPRKAQDPGDDLFSRKAALSVSSALESLTSVFGMGTGMASPLASPGSCCWK